jgi:hypothetical protein
MSESLRERLLAVGALAILAAFFWPTLGLPYLGDDTYNAYIPGLMGNDRLSLAQTYARLFTETNVDVGRFYPIYPALLLFDFVIVHNVVLLKVLVLVAIIANAVTFYILLRGTASAYALLALVALPPAFQIRYFHDPIIQFSLHMQLACEGALLGALGLVAFGRSRRAVYLVLGVVAYAFAALTYEAVYAFVIAYVALAFVSIKDARPRIVAIVSYVSIPVVCSVVAMVFRRYVSVSATSDYAIHLDPGAIVRAIALQTFGVVPASYAALNPSGFLPPFIALLSGAPGAIVLAIVAFVFAVTVFVSLRRRPIPDAGIVFGFAVTIVLLSTPLIALSARWQRDLKPGLAYTPVYFEAFGCALALAVLARVAVSFAPAGIGAVIVSGLFAFVIASTYRANELAMAHYLPWAMSDPRALDAGILGSIPEHTTVYLDDSYPAQRADANGDAHDYLYAHTGKRLEPAHLVDLPRVVSPDVVAMEGEIESFSTGRVVAGPIASVKRIADANEPMVERARVYDETAERRVLTDWKSSCGPIVLSSLLAGHPSATSLHYDTAMGRPERDGAVSFRWASGPTVLTIANASKIARSIVLDFIVRPARLAAYVRIASGSFAQERLAVTGDVPVRIPATISPHNSLDVRIASDNEPVGTNTDGRVLRYEVRALQLREPACETRAAAAAARDTSASLRNRG